ncbi:triphosphoribosyl-dephospho-CoA synthase [Peribacillus glennii]|uniref:triphosphoribosyl-dephospho-CoA synthase n=1 Tax=Peribacillus glennii TaxID=2303991 RepID=A0A372LG33_9BACI|nr:triphosphoribosyl-dephospho-CoA synthase [Peribacillus glennii]RFU64964.1 triphosphoribosyl-dephospho-CoA synthase [Peribacillus glennii]
MILITESKSKGIPYSERLAELAVDALKEEALLTPKPGLVDQESSGAHSDMSIGLMLRSAEALQSTFAEMAEVSFRHPAGRVLREKLAEVGRRGENNMLLATGGINTHKGAIWALGLLIAGAAIHGPMSPIQIIAETAGSIARYPDRFGPGFETNGAKVRNRYGVPGAAGEAQMGFPHVIAKALPVLWNARRDGIPETEARLDALLMLIANLDDTCILHRGGMEGLLLAKEGALNILRAGGSSKAGHDSMRKLDREFVSHNISPGGSADLLAAALFLDRLHVLSTRFK